VNGAFLTPTGTKNTNDFSPPIAFPARRHRRAFIFSASGLYTDAMRMHTFILALAFTASVGSGQDWPRFRGPNGTGLATAPTVPVTWTTNDYNWVAKLPGTGHSSPVIVGSRLFITCADNATAKRMLLCLDTATGQPVWQRDCESQTYQQNNDNSYATPTPAADANGVVAVWASPAQVLMVALDNAGKEVWRRDLGPCVSLHGFATSPIIAGDLVVLSNDQDDPAAMPANTKSKPKEAGKSAVLALDRATGKTRWQLPRTSKLGTYGTPCVRPLPDGRQELILSCIAHGVTGVDLATGKINWELPDCLTRRVVSSPVLGPDLIVTTDGVGGAGVELLAVRPGPKPSIVYQFAKPLPYVPSPIIKGDRLFCWGDTGSISCHKLATGEQIWREKIDGSFYCSPVCINDRLYCVTKSGEAVVLSATDKFELLGRVPLGERSHASPAVANGVLYFRTLTQVFSLGGKKH
jgi:outer membrane protein assembly factor BamB